MNLSASLPLLVLALTVEAAFGYPQRFYAAIGHPVTWIGRLIGTLDGARGSDRVRARGASAAATLAVAAQSTAQVTASGTDLEPFDAAEFLTDGVWDASRWGASQWGASRWGALTWEQATASNSEWWASRWG